MTENIRSEKPEFTRQEFNMHAVHCTAEIAGGGGNVACGVIERCYHEKQTFRHVPGSRSCWTQPRCRLADVNQLMLCVFKDRSCQE